MRHVCGRAIAAVVGLVQSSSLRFRDPATERAYVESRTPSLTKYSVRLFCLFLCAGAAAWPVHVIRGGQPEENGPGTGFFEADIGLIVGWMAMGLLVVAAAATGALQRHLGCFARERFVVAMTAAMLLVACCLDPYYLAKICGCGALPGSATDTSVLLKIDTIVTMAHMGLPIRWEVMLLLDAVAVSAYGVFAFGLGSPEPNLAVQHWIFLVVLTAGAVVGKHNVESHERSSFQSIARERTQKTELEFELSRQRHAQAVPEEPAAEATSVSPSAAPSDATGRLFGEVDDHGLHRIAGLGRREHWLLPDGALKFAPQDVLGEGSFGIVFAGLLHSTPVAIKIPTSSAGAAASVRRLAELANELRVLRQLRNAHVVHFIGACVDFERGYMALVEELVEGPSLGAFLERGGGPDDAARRCLALGVCRGLQSLHAHEPCIVHGDLKPDNIRVEQLGTTPRVKLLDFGLSRVIADNPKPLGGTLRWMAPEVIRSRSRFAPPVPPSPAADIFSLGRVVYFIATGLGPLEGYKDSDMVASARAGRVLPLRWPAGPSPFGLLCAPVAERCTSWDPAARPEVGAVHGEFFRWRPPGGGSDGQCEGMLAHPSPDCVPWQEGLQRVLAARSRPRSPLRPGIPGGAGRRGALEAPHSGPPRAAGEEPQFGRFSLTPPITQQRMLINCMAHWNVARRSTHCCSYHATVDSARGAFDALWARACNDVLIRVCAPGGQCANCLAMRVRGEGFPEISHCSVCDFSFEREEELEEDGSGGVSI